MDRQTIVKTAAAFIEGAAQNYISKEIAISPAVVAMKIFEEPIFAFGDAEDALFSSLQEREAVGPHFMLPGEWLPGARTVISFFLPFSAEVKESNYRAGWPSDGWLHGRIEGQALLNDLSRHLRKLLTEAGCQCVAPSLDSRFWAKQGRGGGPPEVEEPFTSNWSERHVAYVCGLGTFCLSKGLITEKGVAGRFGSLVTDLVLEQDKRAYDSLYGYCTRCGRCVKRCPVRAISLEKGKAHKPCGDFVDRTEVKYDPRYGCGKCQTDVPCESRIPV